MAFELRGKPALIISECQRGVIERGLGSFAGLVEQVEQRGIVPRIATLAEAFRAAGHPVVHAPVAHRADFADIGSSSMIAVLARKHGRMVEGTAEADFVETLRPHPSDIVAGRSSGMIAFNGTALDVMLRRMNVETVVMTGVSTNIAIAGCTLTASDLGYHVVIPEDCIAGADPRAHEVILNEQLRMMARIVTARDLIDALKPGLLRDTV